jgi:hypothetical protein
MSFKGRCVMSRAANVAKALGGRKAGSGWTARCPAHEDGHNSPGRNISQEDARQIVENVTGFFAILAGWMRAELSAPANGYWKAHCLRQQGGRP